MPRRPRAHVLEAEARRAFRALIEVHGWVVRAADSPDYGIDDVVEVFEDGEATGLFFFVQSRGTDKAIDSAMSVRVRLEQQKYFSSLDNPVLVARYHSPTKTTYAKWFHRVDPYPRPNSQTVHFEYSDALNGTNVPRLADEVRVFRSWSASRLDWPVPCTWSLRNRA